MRIANLAGRATIVTDDGLIDLATASQGAFSSSVDKCVNQIDKIRTWFVNAAPTPTNLTTPSELLGDSRLGPVVVTPQQIFAVALNYRHHAEEMGLVLPSEPMVFTKFVSSLCGPNDDVPLPSATTDFEAELVVVIGSKARRRVRRGGLGRGRGLLRGARLFGASSPDARRASAVLAG